MMCPRCLLGWEVFLPRSGWINWALDPLWDFMGRNAAISLDWAGRFSLTAMGMLAGEEGGHTAEFLLTHPVSRRRIAVEKLAALAAMILALNLACLACGAGGVLAIGEEAEWGDLLRYHGALLLMQLETGGLCFALSSLLRRSSYGMAIGLAAGLYFLGLMINLDPGLEPLRFVTPYYYADAARIFAGEALSGPILTGCLLGALGACFGLWRYERKDIAA